VAGTVEARRVVVGERPVDALRGGARVLDGSVELPPVDRTAGDDRDDLLVGRVASAARCQSDGRSRGCREPRKPRNRGSGRLRD